MSDSTLVIWRDDGWFHCDVPSTEGAAIGGRLVGDTFTDNGATLWNAFFGDRFNLGTELGPEDSERWGEIASHYGASVTDNHVFTMERSDCAVDYDATAFLQMLVVVNAYNDGIVS